MSVVAEAKIDDNTAGVAHVGRRMVKTHGTSGRRAGPIALVGILCSCGAAAVDVSAAFASIQVDEARIEHASLALETAGDADARRAQSDEICAASTHLCGTAQGLDDRDANARCAHAEARCDRARQESVP